MQNKRNRTQFTNDYYLLLLQFFKIPQPAMCPEEQIPSFTVKGAPEVRHEGAVCSFTISFTLTGSL